MKILFLATDWNTAYRQTTGEYGGIGYYRAYMPAKHLEELGHEVTVLGSELAKRVKNDDPFTSYKKIFKGYDAIVLKQLDSKIAGMVIGAAKDLKIPIAMDLDDNILEIDPSNPAYAGGYNEEGVKRAFAAASLSMCDALFVSTQPLKDTYKAFLSEVMDKDMPTYVLPNCCVPRHWSNESQVTKKMTIIGWHGSITHDEDLKLAIPAINKLMKKYDNLYVQFMGGLKADSAPEVLSLFDEKFMDRISVAQGTPSWKGFPEYLTSLPWDIGIAPLEDTKFTRGKSHIKWMEYALKGIPCVASDVYPYAEPIDGVNTIVDGETGFLASNTDEWYNKLDKLITDNTLRRTIAKNARNYVKDNWQYKHHSKKWEKAIKELVERGSE